MKRISFAKVIPIVCLFLLAGCQKQAELPVSPQGNTTKNAAGLVIHIIPAWLQAASPTAMARQSAIGFSIGSKGYVGGGETGPPSQTQHSLTDFWEYDPGSNAWTQKASMPIPLQQAASFVVGTKGYVCTGFENSSTAYTSVNYLFQYDQASNTWYQKASFPGGARYGAIGINIGSQGYVGTGWQNGMGAMNDWWQYDPPTDHWTQEAYFPGSGRMCASGFSIGYLGYITCGTNPGSAVYNDLWQYWPTFNIWTRRADLPATSRELATGFNYGSYGALTCGLIGAGPQQFTALNDFWYYQPSNNQWYQSLNMGGGARFAAVGFSINGTPYVGTGFNYNSGYLNDFWYLGYIFI